VKREKSLGTPSFHQSLFSLNNHHGHLALHKHVNSTFINVLSALRAHPNTGEGLAAALRFGVCVCLFIPHRHTRCCFDEH
jgi:hypothetical protein